MPRPVLPPAGVPHRRFRRVSPWWPTHSRPGLFGVLRSTRYCVQESATCLNERSWANRSVTPRHWKTERRVSVRLPPEIPPPRVSNPCNTMAALTPRSRKGASARCYIVTPWRGLGSGPGSTLLLFGTTRGHPLVQLTSAQSKRSTPWQGAVCQPAPCPSGIVALRTEAPTE